MSVAANCTGDTFTRSTTRSSRHEDRARIDWPITHAPMTVIRPDRSAIEMNCSGPSSPSWG